MRRRTRPRPLHKTLPALLAVALAAAALTTASAAHAGPVAHRPGGSGPRGGHAHAASAPSSGPVIDGPARFEVITPTLVRMEYAADGHFQDGQTFNVVNRAAAHPPRYSVGHQHGWLTIRTGGLLLRYRSGSGPFTPQNTAITLTGAGRDAARGSAVTAHPAWPAAPGSCRFGTGCQAEDGRISGGESVNYDHTGFTGRGFAADYGQKTAGDTWTIRGVPADGTYALQARYANGGGVSRTLTVTANNAPAGQLSFPGTADWDTWATTSVPVQLHAGTNTIHTECTGPDSCNVNLDSVAVTAPGDAYPTTSTTPAPPANVPGQLGGWSRGLDAYPNQAGTDITQYQEHPGLLYRRGWALLDDTYTALRTADGWATPRPQHTGAYQDGYFFGYGQDYKRALEDLRVLTGPADMLPQWAFGVWFSEYYPFTTSDYENNLVPAFRSHHVALDALSVDTDWKSPQQWDGWNWNPGLFPDPQAFLDWAHAQHINVALNVHAGIDGSDPKFAQTNQTAGGLDHAAQCFSPDCYRFDWSTPAQAKAWFDLHHPFEQQGVRQWWLDWCCTDSVVDMPGLTPDSWINELYARDLTTSTHRGFNLARIGASFEDYRGAPASGPWGEGRTTVQFTGDTKPSWASLADEVHFAPDEASIGEPYVSHDIGSFMGKHLPDDLYARWVQLGAFQPVLRLHSDHGDRLPWQYGAGQQAGTDALQLREALVPYTYSLAWNTYRTGLPITRPLYLDYPTQQAAYNQPGEYLYGPDVLVAPVTTPGNIATKTVWFPPGRWTDYYTGATYTGPGTATVTVPLDQAPVFVKAGGIIPEEPGRDNVDAAAANLTLKVFSGASGRFTLHTDAGDGLGYRTGQYADVPITYQAGDGRGHGRVPATSSVRIAPATGTYPGAPGARSYTVDLVDVSAPRQVRVDGRPLPRTTSAPGWSYDPATQTLRVATGDLSVHAAHTITQVGGRSVTRPVSAAVDLTLDPATPTTLQPGASTTVTGTVTNAGPGSISQVRAGLSAPDGWTVAPTGAQQLGTLAQGGTATQTWTVTAPAGGTGPVTADLKATVTYVSDATGAPGEVTTYQGPEGHLPPTITALDPASAAAGDTVTIHGTNFGATQGDPSTNYVLLADNGNSWGAPYDGATFHILKWSDTAITFQVPDNPGEPWKVAPGTTAQVWVYTDAGQSNEADLKITQ